MDTIDSALDTFKSFFAEKLVHDDREPIATFSIPGLDGTFGFFEPKNEMTTQVALLLFIQTIIQSTFGFLIYQVIVKNRKSWLAYAFGWLVLIPAATVIPYFVLEWLRLENKLLKLSLATHGIIFRCLEAMYGTSPPVVESSLGTYVVYSSTIVHYKWDPVTQKRVPVQYGEIFETLGKLVYSMILLSILLSIELHFNYQPFPSTVKLNQYDLGWDLFSVNHLLNSYIMLHVSYYFLSLAMQGVDLVEQLKGFSVQPVFRNPIFASRSLYDFWCQRWNLPMYRNLTHGVYLPVCKYLPQSLAALLTFLAAGLLHEHAGTIIFYEYDQEQQERAWWELSPLHFKPTVFFLFMGVVLVLESYVSKYAGGFTKTWPAFVLAHLGILATLPASHLYTGDLAWGGAFGDMAISLYHFRKL